MNNLAWIVFGVFLLLPGITYLVYYFRRLETRRKQLLETILSMSLEEEYMSIHHGEKFPEWRTSNPGARISDFIENYFNSDFRAGRGHQDYVWPVALFTILSGVGLFLTLGLSWPNFNETLSVPGWPPPTFAYAFVGAYLACILTLFERVKHFDLDPHVYQDLTFRVLFSSLAGYIIAVHLGGNLQALTAFGIGLFPLQQSWNFITTKAAAIVGAKQTQEALGDDLSKIQGLEHEENRKKLLDAGISSIQSLATADPILLFFRTPFPLRTVVDFIDKAILYLYLGDKVLKLREHGVNGVIELVAVAKLYERKPAYPLESRNDDSTRLNPFFADIKADELVNHLAAVIDVSPEALKTFIYNMYYDPVVVFLYDVWGRYLGPKGKSQTEV
jgi:hypothetical protein